VTTEALAALLGGVVALLGLVLLGRRPKPLSADPPPAAVELTATADERERQLDAREVEAAAEWAAERQVADALRAEADAVDGDDADAVAVLMNGGR